MKTGCSLARDARHDGEISLQGIQSYEPVPPGQRLGPEKAKQANNIFAGNISESSSSSSSSTGAADSSSSESESQPKASASSSKKADKGSAKGRGKSKGNKGKGKAKKSQGSPKDPWLGKAVSFNATLALAAKTDGCGLLSLSQWWYCRHHRPFWRGTLATW